MFGPSFDATALVMRAAAEDRPALDALVAEVLAADDAPEVVAQLAYLAACAADLLAIWSTGSSSPEAVAAELLALAVEAD